MILALTLAAAGDAAFRPDLPATLAVLLGAIGVYLLLPRPKRYPTALGAVCIALALAAATYAGWDRAAIEPLLFYGFSGLAILGGLMVVTQANPARAALSFVVVVLATCGLFLLNAAPFLMAGTVIVYAGAIVVTFLFVLMLAQPDGVSDADQRSREPLLACVAGCLLLATLLVVVRQTFTVPGFDGWLVRVRHAKSLDSADAVRFALGDKFAEPADELLDRTGVERRSQTQPLEDALRDVNANWKSDDVDGWRVRLTALESAAVEAHRAVGRLQPPKDVKLSPFAGSPANRPAERMSADNVGGIGRALFSDYLLAVELAGTLLLIATVGAIAIATRNTARRAT
ncbi:MAG: NADH-quinone oxidoreductase subunit J [Gemmataceae bacterium]